jgi:chromosome segregation ATPase
MKLNNFIPVSGLVLFLLASCSNQENERLRAENDSLRHELETRYSVVEAMREITILIDSIDNSRNVLHINLREGTTYNEVTERLGNINEYVKKTSNKITAIEKELNSTKSNASAYRMMVEALKDELSIRASEIENLEVQVANYQTENKGLHKTVKLQETELVEMRSQITTKQQELSLIEAKVDELVDNFKVTEAEAYYARAQAVEEAAKRTKLAPLKKKETYREALALYEKALSLGKAESKEKISELQKKIN